MVDQRASREYGRPQVRISSLLWLTFKSLREREHISASFDEIYTAYTFSKFLFDWHYASKPSSSMSLCRLHMTSGHLAQSSSEFPPPLPFQISFLGPLSIQFKPTHGVYRNKRLTQQVAGGVGGAAAAGSQDDH